MVRRFHPFLVFVFFKTVWGLGLRSSRVISAEAVAELPESEDRTVISAALSFPEREGVTRSEEDHPTETAPPVGGYDPAQPSDLLEIPAQQAHSPPAEVVQSQPRRSALLYSHAGWPQGVWGHGLSGGIWASAAEIGEGPPLKPSFVSDPKNPTGETVAVPAGSPPAEAVAEPSFPETTKNPTGETAPVPAGGSLPAETAGGPSTFPESEDSEARRSALFCSHGGGWPLCKECGTKPVAGWSKFRGMSGQTPLYTRMPGESCEGCDLMRLVQRCHNVGTSMGRGSGRYRKDSPQNQHILPNNFSPCPISHVVCWYM